MPPARCGSRFFFFGFPHSGRKFSAKSRAASLEVPIEHQHLRTVADDECNESPPTFLFSSSVTSPARMRSTTCAFGTLRSRRGCRGEGLCGRQMYRLFSFSVRVIMTIYCGKKSGRLTGRSGKTSVRVFNASYFLGQSTARIAWREMEAEIGRNRGCFHCTLLPGPVGPGNRLLCALSARD